MELFLCFPPLSLSVVFSSPPSMKLSLTIPAYGEFPPASLFNILDVVGGMKKTKKSLDFCPQVFQFMREPSGHGEVWICSLWMAFILGDTSLPNGFLESREEDLTDHLINTLILPMRNPTQPETESDLLTDMQLFGIQPSHPCTIPPSLQPSYAGKSFLH